MSGNNIPEFAIMGHPNEGKSSVVSTLSEDDSVSVSPTPGETVECQEFPVAIDGEEIIRFIDTPGFQYPKRTLAWLQRYKGPADGMVEAFCGAHRHDPAFRNECELLGPIARGAGIIYVADASRPMRKVDRVEMEILRMTGQPRMAIINSKEGQEDYLAVWKNEFRKNFNATRVFNAHNATYAERIALLENLKNIDQDWQPALEKVISAFKRDWQRRNDRSAERIADLLQSCLRHVVTGNFSDRPRGKAAQQPLQERYGREIAEMERKTHQKIRERFKHNIFNYDLPEHSILHEALFAVKTWRVLGLNRRQLAAAGAVGGGVIGALADAAAAGLTFGIFTAIGSAIGAGAAYFGGEHMARVRIIGLKLGGYQLRIGPNKNLQFMYVLLDRALIYYSHIINWAHGCRDYGGADQAASGETVKRGYVSMWNDAAKGVCNTFFNAAGGDDAEKLKASRKALVELIRENLDRISRSERKMF